MSRKTRQEKIIADLRRKLKTGGLVISQSLPVQPLQEKITAMPAKAHAMAADQKQSLYIYPPQLIKRDLTKTGVLAILAVSLEIGIYFFLK